MAITPLSNRVVAIKQQPQEKTASGILLGTSKESPAYAIVESVGPDVKSVKKDDKIIFKDYSTTSVKIDNTEYLILEDKDILATL